MQTPIRPLVTWAVVLILVGALLGIALDRVAFASSALPLRSSEFCGGGSLPEVTLNDPFVTCRLDGSAVRAGLGIAEERHVGKPDGGPRGLHGAVTKAVGSVTRPDSPATAPARTVDAILAIIRNAAVEASQDPEAMIEVARCESALDPNAIGDSGDAAGIWQFHLATWTANARRLFGHDVGDLRLDPARSSMVAAYRWSIGQKGAWTCAR